MRSHLYGGAVMVDRRTSAVPKWYPLIGIFAIASIAAVLVVAHSSSTTRAELEMPWEYRRMSPYQQLVQSQPSLMDEGSIQMDPSKTQDAAAEFFRQNEESTQTDEDVPDAGPGNILPGWTHPELVSPPNPLDLQSFEAPDGRASVYSPDDYTSNPGAVEAVESARSTIAGLQEKIASAHEEAENAKAVYDQEETKSKKLEREYMKYVQAMRSGRARNHNWSSYRDTKKSIGMWAPPTPEQQAARMAQTQTQQSQPIDSSSGDTAKRFYQESSPQQSLFQQYRPRQQSLVSFPADAAFRQEQMKRQNLLEREEQAIRDRTAKVQLAQDVARLQLARKRLAEAISRPSMFKAKPLHFQEYCPEGTPGCETQSQMRMEAAARGAVGSQSEYAMRTAGDREVPTREAQRQEPHWIGDTFMH